MNLLLDAHVLLWALADDSRLREEAAAAITAGSNRVLVSAVSAWEITIKRSLGKLRAPEDLAEQVARMRLEPLDIRIPHAEAVGALPPHHRDPFDCMLIAQARCDGLTLVTADPRIRRYDVPVLVAG